MLDKEKHEKKMSFSISSSYQSAGKIQSERMYDEDDTKVEKIGDYLEGKKIALCVTGGIAAAESYKIARALRRYGAEVEAYLTEDPLSLNTELWMEWATEREVVKKLTGKAEHIRKKDLVLVAPATLNTIGKFAKGIADNPVTALLASALGYETPIIMVPTMHESMYRNPVYKENEEKLEKYGVKFLEPRMSEGKAKIPGTEYITASVIRNSTSSSLKGKKILINAGPTSGKIDDVRKITSNFRGKLGIEIADEAYKRGADVKLVYGDGGISIPNYIDTTKVKYFEEMHDEVMKETDSKYDIGIFSAAVNDYIPEKAVDGKIKSKGGINEIKLKETPKIIEKVREKCPDLYMVTFKLESKIEVDELLEIGRKRLDKYEIVVVNRLEDMEKDKHISYILEKDSEEIIRTQTKKECAKKLLDALEKNFSWEVKR